MNRHMELSTPVAHWQRNRNSFHPGQLNGEGFKCRYCQAYVHTITMLSGVQNRNHCPYCLRSRHMDLNRAGDRLSACKAIMQPIGLTVKARRSRYDRRLAGEPHALHAGEPPATPSGELMLVHVCSECGEISINRIAADDLTDVLSSLLELSYSVDDGLRIKLGESGIHLLQSNDRSQVLRQLYGTPPK